MIEELKRIEEEMQGCIGSRDRACGHIDADSLMSDLALVLSQRCYDEERQCVGRICTEYVKAVKDRWYHA